MYKKETNEKQNTENTNACNMRRAEKCALTYKMQIAELKLCSEQENMPVPSADMICGRPSSCRAYKGRRQ